VAELIREGFDASDAPGETSQFDVIADGELVFSKQHVGRFPDAGEMLAVLVFSLVLGWLGAYLSVSRHLLSMYESKP